MGLKWISRIVGNAAHTLLNYPKYCFNAVGGTLTANTLIGGDWGFWHGTCPQRTTQIPDPI